MRKYLPTLADLIDRLSICQLKAIFIPGNSEQYEDEIALITHDLEEVMREGGVHNINGKFIRAIIVLAITNRYIWENEYRARSGGSDQDKLLKLTHSINGVRTTAKNVISRIWGERVDLKVDCLAEELVKEYGNWNIPWDREAHRRIAELQDSRKIAQDDARTGRDADLAGG